MDRESPGTDPALGKLKQKDCCKFEAYIVTVYSQVVRPLIQKSQIIVNQSNPSAVVRSFDHMDNREKTSSKSQKQKASKP